MVASQLHKGFKWVVGDESNPTLALLVDNVSRALHIAEATDAQTDWAVSADTNPSVYIHSATNPATEYIKMYHDTTDANIDCVGATALNILIAGTAELELTSSAFSPGVTNSNALGTTALMWSDLFLASGGVINFNNGDVTLTHATNALALVGGCLNLHTSVAAYAFTAGTPAFALYTTNASVHASTSAESFLVYNTQTGIAGVGGRARFFMTTNVALGGWSNALKAEVTYGTAGRTTGLGSAFCAEITLSAGTTSGTYAPLESELTAASGAKTGTATSFLYMNAGTDTDSVINGPNGYLFELGAGITDTAGGIFEAETVAAWAVDFTHVLKIRIAGTAYYIGLNTAKTF